MMKLKFELTNTSYIDSTTNFVTLTAIGWNIFGLVQFHDFNRKI